MTHPNDELKACPFCGNVPALDDDGTLARCATSGCPLACYGFCIDAWNARAKDEVKGGEAVAEVVRTAPEVIYLQIAEDEFYRDRAFPTAATSEITWCADSVLDVEVKYIRADLHTSLRSIAVGSRVPDAIGQAPAKLRGLAGVIRTHGTCAAAALETVASEIDAAMAERGEVQS